MKSDVLYDINVEKINSVFTVYNEKTKMQKRVNRSCWAIILKYEGETKYVCNNKCLISDFANMVILPKGSSYEWECTKSGRYYAIEFECETVCDDIFGFHIKDEEKILNLFKEMERRLILKRSTYKLENIKCVYDILLMLVKSKHPQYMPSKKQQKISFATDYILENYNKPLKNDDLASLTGLSTIYFRKLFTETFGISPMAYIHGLRIKKAEEILKSDFGSLTEVALSLGYPNIYDFSRAFKNHTGISPSGYIKEKRSEQTRKRNKQD